MKRPLAVVVLSLLMLQTIACTNRGEKISDRVNEKMVQRIQDGKVQNETALNDALDDVLKEVFKEMEISEDDEGTEAEKDSLEKRLKEYKESWKKLIREEPWKKE